MMFSVLALRSQSIRSQRIRAAVQAVLRELALDTPVAVRLRHGGHLEALERRLLLSGYTQSEVSYVGSNAGGANPLSTLVVDSAGNLFGTTSQGGAYAAGTIFEIAKGSGTITTLLSFDGADGSDPCSGLTMDSAGNLYGTTFSGGPQITNGTVYEIASGTNSLTTIASFNRTDGYNPYGGVTLDSAGDIFGTTEHGTGSAGTVFEIAHGSNAITNIATFNGTNGSNPMGGVAFDSAGNIYGTTAPNVSGGTIFEIASGSSTITTLVTFSGSDASDATPIVTTVGNVYGTTTGGTSNDGTVYEFKTANPFVQTLASFNGANGKAPLGALTLDGSGNLYGTTSAGGNSGDGTVFCIPSGSTAITDLASFGGTNGLSPEAGVALDASGDVFGTTYKGGVNSSGTVFEVAKGSNQATTLASFQTRPNATLLQNSGVSRDAYGNLYGTTSAGGVNADGTVFEIPNGSSVMTILASFDGTDGANPYGGVTLDQAGNLYGTTTATAASFSTGTIFEIARGSSSITTLASSALLHYSNYPVTLDSSGNIYGTTMYGGASNLGTVFELAKGSNALTTLATFGNSLNSGNPWAGVTLDAAGDIFGTTTVGGFGGNGTVFEIVKGTNTIKTIASFQSATADGQTPEGSIVLDPSGNLYGTTSRGGANNNGTVYEITHGSSTVTALDSFTSTTGDDSRAGLTLDLAGNLYGTTYGYTNGPSSVFEIPHGSATITRLVGFNIFDGAAAAASLTLDPWGNLYGTTSGGGVTPIGQGTVFELSTNSAIALQPGSGPNPSHTAEPLTFTAAVSGGVPNGETVNLVDTSTNDALVASGTLSSGSATLTVPAGTLSAGTHNLIAVYAGDSNFGASESAPFVQTVTSDPLPSYITASTGAAFGYNSVAEALNLTTGTLTFTADNTAAPLINVTASGPASGVFFETSEHLAGLALSGGAQATVLSLGSARTHSNHNVLVIGTPGSANDPTFSIDSSSKLDLTDNDMIVHTGSSDNGNGVPNSLGVPSTNELGTARALALAGRNVAAGSVLDGTWTGGGLTSSSAAGIDSKAGYEQNVLAVVQNSDQILGKLPAWTVGNFSEPLGANDIIVKYTYNGDAALEGFVGDDSVTIVNGFYDGGKSTQNDWAFGDFTGDGKVDDNDITILNGLYGNGTASSGLPQL